MEPQETCSCSAPVYHVTIANPSLLAALWNKTGDNELGVVTPYAPIPYYLYGTWVTWVRARIGSGSGQPAEDVCIYDAYGVNCGVTNQCVIGSLQDVIDESVTVSTAFTAEDQLSTTPFAGALPGSIDIGSVPDGAMRMCVEPAGPARLYAADGVGGLYLVDPVTGMATAAGSLPFGVLALAHDDLARRTWAQTNLPGSQTLAEVDLIRRGSRGQASYFGLPFSGAEMVGGRLYGVESSASGARLLEVDPVTGTRRVLREAWRWRVGSPARTMRPRDFFTPHTRGAARAAWRSSMASTDPTRGTH